MGFFEKLRTDYILKPLADYLIDQNKQSMQKDAMGPAVLRQSLNNNRLFTRGKKPNAQVDFKTLRNFSVQYDVARACVNRRKRQISQLEWDVVLDEKDSTATANISTVREIKDKLRTMGGYQVRMRQLTDKIIEDLLVLDAVALEKRQTNGGGFYGLLPVDASTIKLNVTESGMIPEPPEMAYEQWIGGQRVAEWTADEMYYEMLNPRTNSPYGLSPIESLVLGVSTALKSDLYNLHMLTEGNVPEGFFGVPAEWSVEDIKSFQETFDAALAGNSQANSRIRFMPDGKYTATKKAEDMRYKELQDWLMRRTCMLFEIQPQELGFTDTVNRSTGEVQQEISQDSGLRPIASFLKDIFDDVIKKDMGYEQYSFKFTGLEERNEKLDAEVAEIRIRSGFSTVDEERKAKGLAELGVDKPFVIGTPTFIDQESMQQKADAAAAVQENMKQQTTEPADGADSEGTQETTDEQKSFSPEERHIELVSELRAFRKYALSRITKGKTVTRPFVSHVLPPQDVMELNKRIAGVKDKDEARDIFAEYMRDYQTKFLTDVVDLKTKLRKVTHE